MRGLSQGFQQGRPPFSQQPHRGGVPEDASKSIAWRRGCRPAGAVSDGATTAQSAAPRLPRPAGGGLSYRDPGTDREPLPSGARLHRVPGRSPGRSSLDGPPSPKGRWASQGCPRRGETAGARGPRTVRPPQRDLRGPTGGRHVRRAGGRGSTGAARELPGSPFQGPSAARPGGVRLSFRPQRSRLPQGLLSTVSRPRPYSRDAL